MSPGSVGRTRQPISSRPSEAMIASNDPWLRSYFQGPRGRTIFSEHDPGA